MPAPMTDLHIKHVLDLGFKTIRANPDKHLKDIFGDSRLDPHAALYGQRTIEQVKNWISKTEIPIVLGFDVVETRLPAVTVHLAASVPSQSYIGDTGIGESEELEFQEKEILVSKFSPKGAEPTDDPKALKITLQDEMSEDQKELFLPGLKIRDTQGREYDIRFDEHGNLLFVEISEDAPISQIILHDLEVISPVIVARYKHGVMTFHETVNVVVHGHSSRAEGLWLYYIVMWTLLKFRPILTSTFGLDLALSRSSDYSKDDAFLGDQVWRRYITVEATTNWAWESARQKDILGLLLTVSSDRADS